MLFLYVNLIYKLLNAISIYYKQFDSLLNNSFFFRLKPVREGERRSRRKLGLAPELKASDLPVRTRRPRVLVQVPQPVPVIQTPLSVPVEPMTPERPRELVVTPVTIASSPTAVHSADVDDETMAGIGQGVVGEAPCVALEVVAAEHVLE
jgi:hypothetical protein